MKKTNSHNQNCSSLHYKEEVGARDEQNPTTFANETKDGPNASSLVCRSMRLRHHKMLRTLLLFAFALTCIIILFIISQWLGRSRSAFYQPITNRNSTGIEVTSS